jgi:nitrogen fixation protein FixH
MRIRVWPGMVFGLIGLNFGVVAVTFYLAHSDPSFAVEPDYDRKALAWDETSRLAARSAALGWTATLEVPPPDAAGDRPFTVRLTDRAAAPVDGATVQIEAFASARASERRRINLRRVEPGLYEGALGRAAGGLWEFRITATRDTERFEASLEEHVTPASEDRP